MIIKLNGIPWSEVKPTGGVMSSSEFWDMTAAFQVQPIEQYIQDTDRAFHYFTNMLGVEFLYQIPAYVAEQITAAL